MYSLYWTNNFWSIFNPYNNKKSIFWDTPFNWPTVGAMVSYHIPLLPIYWMITATTLNFSSFFLFLEQPLVCPGLLRNAKFHFFVWQKQNVIRSVLLFNVISLWPEVSPVSESRGRSTSVTGTPGLSRNSCSQHFPKTLYSIFVPS